MPKVVRLSLFFLALWGMPALLCAQQGDPVDRFLIEKITIEGLQRRSARAIVTAETRLQEGETYTEAALRQAIYRVKRLPFVLDAEMSLRRGSERGAYELVVTVEPTRPVFFLAQTDGRILSEDTPFSNDDRFFYSSRATAGVRQFLGTRGLVFASVSKSESYAPSYQAGYTRYNLAGAGSYGSVGIQWERDDHLGERERTGASAELGLPLAANHSLRSRLSWSRSVGDLALIVVEPPERFTIDSRSETWGAGLDWIYDTTDDPVFSTEGEQVTGTVSWRQGEGRGRLREEVPLPVPALWTDESATSLDLGLSGRRHFRLTSRQSVAAGAGVSFSEYEQKERTFRNRSRTFSTGLEGRHSLSLWGFEKTERFGDLRLESGIYVSHSRIRASYLADDASRTSAGLSSSVVFRNAWGILRVSLSYFEDDL